MSTWDYRRIVLRQDEVAEFIRSTKGDKYSALLPLLGLHELEIGADNLRQLAKAVEEHSKLNENRGFLRQTLTKRKEVFSDDTDKAIEKRVNEVHAKYCTGTFEAQGYLAGCKELETTLSQRIGQLSSEERRHLVLQSIANTDIAAGVTSVRGFDAKLAGSVEPLILEKLGVLQSAHSFALKLNEEIEVACPACGRPIAVDEFQGHVNSERTRLEDINRVFDDRKAAIALLVSALGSIKTAIAKEHIKTWCEELKKGPLKQGLEWIQQFNAEQVRQSLDGDGLITIEQFVLPIILKADEDSRDALPDVHDLVTAKTLTEAAKAVFNAKVLEEEVHRIESLIAFLRSLETGVREEIRERSQAVVDEISGNIGAMWKILHPAEPIENVRLCLPNDDKAIDIALTFHGKDQDSPRLTLSEGYRNSLGLCVFLAMAKREASDDKPVFLDDVVVSLDRNHRGMITQLLENEFAGRQVIMLTHDRNWYAELRHQLDEKTWKFKALLPYEEPIIGIRWSHKTTTFGDARAHLKDRPDSACNDARKIMDVELALAAEELQLRLPYRRGDKNDKRMAHEFLERLIDDSKKCLGKKKGDQYVSHPDAIEALKDADRLLVSWANRASHSFDIVPPEANSLIDACEKALDVFKCTSCKKWLWFADAGNAESVQCQCGALRWRYGQG